jgi:alpha-tubulin suppressor-like RCC1 family protein
MNRVFQILGFLFLLTAVACTSPGKFGGEAGSSTGILGQGGDRLTGGDRGTDTPNVGDIEGLMRFVPGTHLEDHPSAPQSSNQEGANYFLASGSSHTCAVSTRGNLKCWGANGLGQLGRPKRDVASSNPDYEQQVIERQALGDDPNEMGLYLPFMKLHEEERTVMIGAGELHTCALMTNGLVKCWGHGTQGQLGRKAWGSYGIVTEDENKLPITDLTYTPAQGDKPAKGIPTVDLGTGRTAKLIAAGQAHTCAILDDDTVKCWGSSRSGELGRSSASFRQDIFPNYYTDQDYLDIVALGKSSIQTIGAAKWTLAVNIGDDPREMGDNLPTVRDKDGNEIKAKQIFAAAHQTCAILLNGDAACWGANPHFEHINILDKSKKKYNWKNSDGSFKTLKAIDIGFGSGQYNPKCLLYEDGTVACTGKTNVSFRGGFAPQSADLSGFTNIVSIETGSQHSCILLDGGDIRCWGYNDFGQVGSPISGTKTNIPTLVDLGTNPETTQKLKAVSIHAGKKHTCAVLENNDFKCWGANASGQLGQGDKDHRGDGIDLSDTPLADMGNNLPAVDLGLEEKLDSEPEEE